MDWLKMRHAMFSSRDGKAAAWRADAIMGCPEPSFNVCPDWLAKSGA
ncbi:hypothetical protein [Chitinilyticum aquatile]|nr:hypothetical protein [Chitinilyticum aquatile]